MMPMAGQGLPGMGQSPMGGPPSGALEALQQMQQSPSPSGEEEALAKASTFLGLALARVYLRSPKAAKMISDALSRVQSARQELSDLGSGPMMPPPDLMGGSAPGGMPGPSPGGF